MFRRFSINTRLSLAALGFSLVLALGGCGGNDGGGSSQTTAQATSGSTESQAQPLSKAEFIKLGNAICIETKERSTIAYREYSRENTIPSSGPGLATKAADLISTAFAPIYEKQIEEIGALGTPNGDEEEVDAILSAMQQGVEGAKKQPLAFIRGATSLNRASKLAVAYGLTDCSNGNV
jgi:hypothetical protein